MSPPEEVMQEGVSEYHFTYEPPKDDLRQGDLLEKTEALEELLEEVHPYYLKDTYTHFLIITQSCDLVRRNGNPPKSRYVTIAGVRLDPREDLSIP